MAEWWTYSLSSFLLFSPRIYYRLFELTNQALWPAHVVTAMVGVWLVVAARRPSASRQRAALALLGMVWLWVAWAFLYERYASINWAAKYFALGFAAEGVLLIALAARETALPARKGIIGNAVLVFSLLAYPFIAPLLGRPWMQSEIFGIAPDPTAAATLAVGLLVRPPWRWLILPMPLVWCALSGATLRAMQAPEYWILPLLAATTLLAAFRGGKR